MSDACPCCGGELVDDTRVDVLPYELGRQGLQEFHRCAGCDYWRETIHNADGTIIAVAHAPNSPVMPDSCEHVSVPYKLEGGEG